VGGSCVDGLAEQGIYCSYAPVAKHSAMSMVRSSIFIVGRVIEVHTFIISDKPDVTVLHMLDC
jgi:hypothetical protein